MSRDSGDRAVDTVGGLGDPPEGGVQVIRTAEGASFWRPVTPESLRRLNGVQEVCVADLQEVSHHLQVIRDRLDAAVLLARDEGVSWHLIGWSIGTTGEAARQRWGQS